MTSRGGRGWSGDNKSKRFMMVGTKDNLPVGAKTGVVAPVPINTPSLRQEIHGSKYGTATAGINRSSAGGGWGSAAGVAPASAGKPVDDAGMGGKGSGRGQGGGDDVFTRHFPDLRAGLEQAEKLDAVTKASSKVAPLRKPKPDPSKDQGPSLRPKAMLKPTGSAGGGSAATAAAQAAIADAVHNRVATAPKVEERRRQSPTFADEITGTKSRWAERPTSQEGGRGRGGAGRGAGGGRGGSGAWESGSGFRERGSGRGSMHDRERGGAFQDKDYRQNRDRNASGSGRGRESIFGSGAHVGMSSAGQDGVSGGTKTLTTTYVRQHGPPPRKVTSQGTTASAPAQQQEQPVTTQQPTRSSAYSASTPSEQTSSSEAADPWGASTETGSMWRDSSAPIAEQSCDVQVGESSPSQSGSYVRTHGPPRRAGREGQIDEPGERDGGHLEAGSEATSRFGSSWEAPEEDRGTTDRESVGIGERTPSGRWKEPATGSLPPPPTNTRWKEPKDEPRAGPTRWKGREEGHMGMGRWGRSMAEDGDADSSGSVPAPPVAASSPSHGTSWKETADDNWGLEAVEQGGDADMPASAVAEPAEQQHEEGDGTSSVEPCMDAPDTCADDSGPSATPPEEEDRMPDEPFVQQQQAQQPGIHSSSWEPQLPVRTDLWETPGHGRENLPNSSQGPGPAGSSGSGGVSQPWGDPWGASGFALSTSGDQGSSAMASFLGNGPGDPRKGRYLPPALRNRTPGEGNQSDSPTVTPVDQEPETNPASLPQDVPSSDVSAQDLVIPGIAPGGIGVAEAPLYEQKQQQRQQQQQQQQQQQPLEEWQQDGGHGTHRVPQDPTQSPVDQPLHQRQPLNQSHQIPPAQPLHLHDQPRLDREYRSNPTTAFSSFPPQDRHKHQMHDSALHHQFQPDHFRGQPYRNQDQTGRSSLPEHLQRPHFQQEHVQRQQFNQAQMQQQMHVQQHHIPHSLHQPHQQQQRPQQQQGHHQQGYQQGQQQPPPPPQQQQQQQQQPPQLQLQPPQQQQPQPPQQQQPQPQPQQQLAPVPLGNQAAHHSRQQQQQQHHRHQDMGRQTSQAQRMHMQQHQQQSMQHPSSTFMMQPQGISYSDPRAARGGGLGGLPGQIGGAYRDIPPPQQQQQQQSGMPPGTYGFPSPDTHKR